MRLVKFKTKYIAVLNELRKQLVSKYPDKAQRVEYIIDTLIHKVYTLKSHSLINFIHSLYQACKEIQEICEIIPTHQEIDELLKK